MSLARPIFHFISNQLKANTNNKLEMYLRAAQRNKVTSSLFTSTFAICVLLVGANSVLPCPVDTVRINETDMEKRNLMKERYEREQKNIK